MILRQSLPTSWKLRRADERSWIPATVPGCIHTDLRRAGKIPDPFWSSNEKSLAWIENENWVYRCEFKVGKDFLAGNHLELVAEGLDTFAVLTLNGKEIGRTENMFLARRMDVARVLKAGRNALEIAFRSPMEIIRGRITPDHLPEWCDPVGGASLVRKEQCSFGWDWGPRFPTSGIWLPIYLEGWKENRIESVGVVQDHTAGHVALTFRPALARKGDAIIRGTVSLVGKKVASVENLRAEIAEPQLWWPNGHGAQPLYDVELKILAADGTVLDVWRKKIGLRTIVPRSASGRVRRELPVCRQRAPGLRQGRKLDPGA